MLGHRDEHVGRDRPRSGASSAAATRHRASGRSEVHDRLVDHEELVETGWAICSLSCTCLAASSRESPRSARCRPCRGPWPRRARCRRGTAATARSRMSSSSASTMPMLVRTLKRRPPARPAARWPPPAGRRRPAVLGGAVHEVGELVAAEPRHGVAGPHQAGQPLADHGQDQVAGAVPVPVVDHLEVVEVEQQQAERPVRPGTSASSMRSISSARFGQPGERVVVGLPEQPGGQLVPLAHVVQGQDGALEGALVELADGLHLEPAVAARPGAGPGTRRGRALGAVHHHRGDRGQHLGGSSGCTWVRARPRRAAAACARARCSPRGCSRRRCRRSRGR